MKILTPENPEVLSAVVMKDGEIIAETEQNGQLYPQYSIMKSLISLLVGRLCGEGQLTPKTKVSQLLHTGSASISSLTLDELMTMRSGINYRLLFDDRKNYSDYLEACCQAAVTPLAEGQEQHMYFYNNACAYLAGRMVEAEEGAPLDKQIGEYLFQPLGITEYEFEYDPQGHVFGASGLKLKTEDLARLGYGIMTNKICSKGWLNAAVKPRVMTPERVPYGYFFWVLADGNFYMSGKWGQKCFVLPQYHAVIAVNSNMQGRDSSNSYIIRKLLPLVTQ
ncbi:MAG: beta-lactamase family protein [Ruminococcus sp.]|nr:beta-lactamase family protein [Ruminococcus sp.]